MSIEGLKIVVTGRFSRGRKDIEWDLEQAGADVTGSVSGKTDVLICGDDAGSKLGRAKQLGLPILNEGQMELLLAGKKLADVVSGKAKPSKKPVKKKPVKKASKKVRETKKAELSDASIDGLKVVCTGTFSQPRKKLEARLTVAGADVSSSFSGKTQLLVVGDRAGSKLAKAQQSGVPTIDEEQVERLLAGEALSKILGKGAKKATKKAAKKATKKAAKKATKKAAKKAAKKKKKKSGGAGLDGMKVVVTGTFESPRKEVEAALEAMGADVTGSFSGKTELLVVGKKAGSKLAKAKKAGIPIIDADQLEELLSGASLSSMI